MKLSSLQLRDRGIKTRIGRTGWLRQKQALVLFALAMTATFAFAKMEDIPPAPPAPVLPAAKVIARFHAAEAIQGVAVGPHYFYAINNNTIGKYDKQTGKRVAKWTGSLRFYPHINSCIVQGPQLVCAASNHPAVPMASSVEFFDKETLQPVRSVALPPYPGSLTWIQKRGADWFALFANYDPPHGAVPGHDHRWTLLMKLDSRFRPLESWHFPADVLADFAPMSSSGGEWNQDGYLYVAGHSRPELYVMQLPKAGTLLQHVATIPIPTDGQAFGWDPVRPRVLWSINRRTRTVIASRVPSVHPH